MHHTDFLFRKSMNQCFAARDCSEKCVGCHGSMRSQCMLWEGMVGARRGGGGGWGVESQTESWAPKGCSTDKLQ